MTVAFRPAPRRSRQPPLLPLYALVVTALLLHQLLKKQAPATASTEVAAQAGSEPCPVCEQHECPPVADATQQGGGGAAGGAAGGEAGGTANPNAILLPPIDMLEVLGPNNALTSISPLAYMASACVMPLAAGLKAGGASEAQVAAAREALTAKLLEIVGGVAGKPADPSQTLLENLGLPREAIGDRRFLEARELVAEAMGRTAATEEGALRCCDTDKPLVGADLANIPGEPRCGIDCVGYPSSSIMLRTLEGIASNWIDEGYCTDPPFYREGYLNEMVKRRMNNEQYRDWYEVGSLSEDSIVFAFQLLYETKLVFQRQRWLGATCLQNPFDAWSIQDIIHTVKPQLIVEAGTANGGSALLWATVLHAMGGTGRVITVDVNDPTASAGGKGDQTLGANQDNPWEHPLWEQYVTFIHGSTTDASVFERIQQATRQATRVLVLLDSNHEEQHVIQETEMYCPLATPGSYCITQDTKMSRWSYEGPLAGVQQFLSNHPEFSSDRSREFMFTDHPRGYLKRAAEG